MRALRVLVAAAFFAGAFLAVRLAAVFLAAVFLAAVFFALVFFAGAFVADSVVGLFFAAGFVGAWAAVFFAFGAAVDFSSPSVCRSPRLLLLLPVRLRYRHTVRSRRVPTPVTHRPRP